MMLPLFAAKYEPVSPRLAPVFVTVDVYVNVSPGIALAWSTASVSVSTGAIVGAPSVCVRLMLALPVPAAAAPTGWTTASNTDAMVRTTVARRRDLLMPPGMEPLLADLRPLARPLADHDQLG